MLVIALTGGIACGKTTVAAMLRRLGAEGIDADEISRGLTAEGGLALPEIRRVFGDGVFLPDGTLDRKALSAAVFGNAEALARLNAITHPLIRAEMERRIFECRKAGAQVVILDVPLLFEAHMESMADRVLCVTAPEERQIARMAERNGFTREEALRRIRSQMPVAEKAARSDDVIDTDRPLAEVERDVYRLYQGWMDPARKEQA